MIKPTSATIIGAIALLMLTWGCSPPTSKPPTPGKQQIDKARDAVDALSERNKKQEEQMDDLQQE